MRALLSWFTSPRLLDDTSTAAENGGAPATPAKATTTPEHHDSVTGFFRGEIAQVRVWSSPCSESSLQCLVGRSGVLEADAAAPVCLWKADEGTGAVLRNSRPLHPPKPARGAKPAGGNGGVGAEGHAELVGEWAWVPCFDPDDYDSVVVGCESAAAGAPRAASAAAAAVGASTIGAPSSPSSAAQRSERQGEGELTPLAVSGGGSASAEWPTVRALAVADTDLARSLGWRSVSTAGDEEELEQEQEEKGEEEEKEEKDGVEDEEKEEEEESVSSGVKQEKEEGNEEEKEGRVKLLPLSASAGAVASAAGAATAAGASAALALSAAIDQASCSDGRVGEVSAREALLGVLGKLFQQCSVYLAPCKGDALVESLPPKRGSRMEARVQLQLVRREERTLKAVVQPEVGHAAFGD